VVARAWVEEFRRGQGSPEGRAAGVEAEVVEDAPGDQGLCDEGDDLETAAAGRAGEDVHGEDLLEEVSPGIRPGIAVKFTLKDHQEQAVDDVLANLKRARENFKSPDKRQISSFSLTATTGAGKTVMAAYAIEALSWCNEAFDFDPDPGAVVLWFSDDPSLNMQKFNRLRQASEKFTCSNLVHIEPPFAKPRLDPGKVY
jgi:hypothetical protein